MSIRVALDFELVVDEVPDDDTTVLCFDGEDVFEGFHEDNKWFDATGVEVKVVAWAHLPDLTKYMVDEGEQ